MSISEDEATEGSWELWAQTEQGAVAAKAGWDAACQLGITGLNLDQAAAIVHAALAAGWDAEPGEPEPMEDGTAPAHDHHWAILGAQPHTPWMPFGKATPHTIVLIRCTECGEPDSRILPGEWTLHELREDPV